MKSEQLPIEMYERHLRKNEQQGNRQVFVSCNRESGWSQKEDQDGFEFLNWRSNLRRETDLKLKPRTEGVQSHCMYPDRRGMTASTLINEE